MILYMERKWTKECTECKGMVTSHSGGQAFAKTMFIPKTSWMSTLNVFDETRIQLLAEPGEIEISSSEEIPFIPSLKKKKKKEKRTL